MTPAERLKRARHQAGISVPDLAERTGLRASTIRAHESGQNNIRPEAAELYAAALKVPPSQILFGADVVPLPAPGQVRMLPLLGEVQAGTWREVGEPEAPEEYLPWDDPQYRRSSNIYCLTVRGPSMNRYYLDGTIIVVCDTSDCGVREGDHVVVRRMSGSFVETTLKEVVIGPQGRTELWPRSTDPDFQEPIILDRRRKPDESEEVKVTGVVIASYNRRPPRSGVVLF